jgi:hypothetical protein
MGLSFDDEPTVNSKGELTATLPVTGPQAPCGADPFAVLRAGSKSRRYVGLQLPALRNAGDYGGP